MPPLRRGRLKRVKKGLLKFFRVLERIDGMERSEPKRGSTSKYLNNSRRVSCSYVKLIVIYPRPKDIEAFEKLYQETNTSRWR